jgi:hypothetical protein
LFNVNVAPEKLHLKKDITPTKVFGTVISPETSQSLKK